MASCRLRRTKLAIDIAEMEISPWPLLRPSVLATSLLAARFGESSPERSCFPALKARFCWRHRLKAGRHRAIADDLADQRRCRKKAANSLIIDQLCRNTRSSASGAMVPRRAQSLNVFCRIARAFVQIALALVDMGKPDFRNHALPVSHMQIADHRRDQLVQICPPRHFINDLAQPDQREGQFVAFLQPDQFLAARQDEIAIHPGFQRIQLFGRFLPTIGVLQDCRLPDRNHRLELAVRCLVDPPAIKKAAGSNGRKMFPECLTAIVQSKFQQARPDFAMGKIVDLKTEKPRQRLSLATFIFDAGIRSTCSRMSLGLSKPMAFQACGRKSRVLARR